MRRRLPSPSRIAFARRALTYYDSQSGKTFSLPDKLSLNFLHPSLDISSSRYAPVRDFLKGRGRNRLLEACGPRARVLEEVSTILADSNVPPESLNVALVDVFASDVMSTIDLQTTVGTLGDLGVGNITLVVGAHDVTEDALREAIEACLWVDVEGQPMQARLAVRLSPRAEVWKDQLSAVEESQLRTQLDASLYTHTEESLGMVHCTHPTAPAAPLASALIHELVARDIPNDCGHLADFVAGLEGKFTLDIHDIHGKVGG
jgi:hypothetical protein